MSGPLQYAPWPGNVRFRVNVAGVWTDVSRWVKRSGTTLAFSVDSMSAESTLALEIPANQTQPIFEAWQEVRVDNPGPNHDGGATYERYFKGYISDLSSDPQAPSRRLTLHCAGGLALLEKPKNAIIGPYTYPAGTADNVIIADLVAYADMDDEISTVPSVNHVFDTDAEITFQNCTLLEALQQLQQATPTGTEAPALSMYWYDDDPPDHTDNWGWRLQWFQSPLIAISSVKLTDGTVEHNEPLLKEAFYRALSRMRDGKRVINRQTVVGAQDPATGDPITVTVNSVTSQAYLGRILAGKPIVDTTLDTLDKVTARARLEIDRYKDVLETLNNIQTLVPYGVSGPFKVRIKRALEPGLDTYQPYLASKCTLTWDGAGLPVWTLVLGTALPELGRSGLGWRGGVRYQAPTRPPQVQDVTIAENVYRGQSHSSRFHITWTALTTGNIHHYQVNWHWFDGTIWHYNYVDVPHPAADVYLATVNGGLIPGTHYYVDIIPWNIFQQYGPVSATVDAVAAARAAPDPPTSISVTVYLAEAVGLAGGAKVLYTPDPAAAFTDIQYGIYTPDGGDAWVALQTVPNDASPDAQRIEPLTANLTWSFRLRSVTQYGDPGAWSAILRRRVGGAPGPGPIPIGQPPPGQGLRTSPWAPLAGYDIAVTGTGAVVPGTAYWGGDASAAFSTAAGTDTATLTKALESVTPGRVYAWTFLEGQATGAHGRWTVTLQEYDTSGSAVGSPVVLYGPAVPATVAGAAPPHTGQYTPASPYVQLAVTLDADGYSGALTAYVGAVGLEPARAVDDLYLTNIEAKPILFYDGSTPPVAVGRITYDNTGAGTLQLTAPQTGEQIKLYSAAGVFTALLGGAATDPWLTLAGGTGAQFHTALLSADPASPSDGDWWLVVSGGVVKLRVRSGGVTSTLASSAAPADPSFLSIAKWGYAT